MIIYTDGIERSGNVFLSHAMSLMIDAEVKSLQTHQVKTLINYHESHPFVVPVRNAMECISSSKIYRDRSFLEHPERMSKHRLSDKIDLSSLKIENIIKNHLFYTQYLVDNRKFFVVPFDEFTENANPVMIKISHQYPKLQLKSGVTNQDIKNFASSSNSNVFDAELGNLPRPTYKKEEMIKMLKSNFLKEIQNIQKNVDKLHKRYDDFL